MDGWMTTVDQLLMAWSSRMIHNVTKLRSPQTQWVPPTAVASTITRSESSGSPLGYVRITNLQMCSPQIWIFLRQFWRQKWVEHLWYSNTYSHKPTHTHKRELTTEYRVSIKTEATLRNRVVGVQYETMVVLPSHLLYFLYPGKAQPYICLWDCLCDVPSDGDRAETKPGRKTWSAILKWKTEMGDALQLKCYLDASLHKKRTVFGFSLWVTSRAHCDKKISLMLPDLV